MKKVGAVPVLLAAWAAGCASSGVEAIGDAADAGNDAAAEPSCVATFATDPKNWGGCFHDCLGGACVGGVCQVVTIAHVDSAAAAACGDDEVVIASSSTIARARAGGPLTPLVQGVDTPEWPAVTASYVYWLERGALRRAHIDPPGTAEVVASPVAGSTLSIPVALDDSVYLASSSAGGTTIWRAPTAAGPADAIVTAPALGVQPRDALAVSTGGFYVAGGLDVWHVPLSGGTPVVLSKAQAEAPSSIGVNSTYVYFVRGRDLGEPGTRGQTEILRVLVAGGTASPFYLGDPPPAHVLVDERHVYFSTDRYFGTAIYYQRHDAGAASLLVDLKGADTEGILSISQSAKGVCAVLDNGVSRGSTVYRIAKPL